MTHVLQGIRKSNWKSRALLFGVPAILLVIFGTHRIVKAVFSGPDDSVFAAVHQSDGKVILGGKFMDNRIMRLNLDGTEGPTFGAGWYAGGFNLPVRALAVDPQDRIWAVGEFTNIDDTVVGHVARLLSDGSIDRDFANAIGTGFDGPVNVIRLRSDGRALVAGNFAHFNGASVDKVAQLNADGTLDIEFMLPAPLDLDEVQTLSFFESTGRLVIGGVGVKPLFQMRIE